MAVITLQRVEILGRDENGKPYAWRSKGDVAQFYDIAGALRYVNEHPELAGEDVQFFSGSASVLATLNERLFMQRQKASSSHEV